MDPYVAMASADYISAGFVQYYCKFGNIWSYTPVVPEQLLLHPIVPEHLVMYPVVPETWSYIPVIRDIVLLSESGVGVIPQLFRHPLYSAAPCRAAIAPL
jgi:hypothetical protein